MKHLAAIIGSGNIGTDLMFKIMRMSDTLEMGAMVGIDPESDGLARATKLNVPTTAEGVQGLIDMHNFDDIKVVFDATSAGAHLANAKALAPYNKILVDLTPAAIGPYVVPAVNLEEHKNLDNVNMVTCGGQATIPMVQSVSSVTPVHYAEIVASISSKSAGPGTRANIDEFTETTANGLEKVGGAKRGKAIIIMNPAEPPMIMRDTIQMITDRLSPETQEEVRASIAQRVTEVATYVPGYRLKQEVQFKDVDESVNNILPEGVSGSSFTQISVFLEVEGAAMYLPAYAGNLDIMTSAALRTGETLSSSRH